MIKFYKINFQFRNFISCVYLCVVSFFVSQKYKYNFVDFESIRIAKDTRYKNEGIMENTSKYLLIFDNILKKYCKNIYDQFGEPLNNEIIKQMLGKVDIKNEQIEKLYQCHNGIKYDLVKSVGEFEFCSMGVFLPLEEAISHYKEKIKNNLWERRFFPLLTNHAGDYLLLDIDGDSNTFERMFFYSPSLLISYPEIAYDNLESFFQTITLCYKSGAYVFDESTNTLEIDQDKEFEISAEENPNSEYWSN